MEIGEDSKSCSGDSDIYLVMEPFLAQTLPEECGLSHETITRARTGVSYSIYGHTPLVSLSHMASNSAANEGPRERRMKRDTEYLVLSLPQLSKCPSQYFPHRQDSLLPFSP